MAPDAVISDGGARRPPAGPAADLLRRGQAAARRGQRERAQRLLRAVLLADPANTEARLWLAALAEDPREAVQLLNTVLEQHPGHVRAAAGLRWAWERLEAQSVAQSVAQPAPRPRLQPLPTPNLAARMATAVACLAGVLAIVLVVSCGLPAQFMPALVVNAAWSAETVAPTPTAAPTLMPTAAPTLTATPTDEPTSTPAPPPTATPSPTVPPQPTATPAFPGKWIEVCLGDQTATAWEGATAVRRMVVSTGAAGTPTIQGTFRIYAKLTKQNMSGPGYSLANVPHVMYFHGNYALHGAYWHTNFGTPQSHGCVNLNLDDAAWLFAWAGPQLPKGAQNIYATDANPGTPVVVHP